MSKALMGGIGTERPLHASFHILLQYTHETTGAMLKSWDSTSLCWGKINGRSSIHDLPPFGVATL